MPSFDTQTLCVLIQMLEAKTPQEGIVVIEVPLRVALYDRAKAAQIGQAFLRAGRPVTKIIATAEALDWWEGEAIQMDQKTIREAIQRAEQNAGIHSASDIWLLTGALCRW